MRRIAPWFVKDPFLKGLILGTGSLKQARNELRWLRQELADATQVQNAVRMRSRGYPLQYLLGTQPFGELSIHCKPGVLIPRWETEEWVSELAQRFRDPPDRKVRFLDLCSGTGCVLFGLCDLLPAASGVATDTSARAIALFKKNQSSLGMTSRTQCMEHDLFAPLPAELREVDCVVANPPYITNLQEAEPDVRRFEPHEALIEPENIWEALVARVMETSATSAVFEVGYEHQIETCRMLFVKHGWKAKGQRDSRGNWRTVWAFKRLKNDNSIV